MSALGQKQTFAPQKAMSALPPIATGKQTSAEGYGEKSPDVTIYDFVGIATVFAQRRKNKKTPPDPNFFIFFLAKRRLAPCRPTSSQAGSQDNQ